MFNIDYGTRLDQFDYERFGINDRWYFRDTIFMLTSFEMEIRGYYASSDSKIIYEKIFHKYDDYLSNCMFKQLFPYNHGLLDEDLAFLPEDAGVSFDRDRANFCKETFMNHLKTDPKITLDIYKLEMCLRGEEIPSIKGDNSEQKSIIYDNNEKIESDLSNAVKDNINIACSQQYAFRKTTQSWDIHFGNEVLNGVKNYTGMHYIQLLLQNPGRGFGVIEIQTITCTECIQVPGSNRVSVLEDEGNQARLLGESNPIFALNKIEALKPLKDRLKKLSAERQELKDYEHAEQNRIDNEVERIQEEIDNIQYAKIEDPELESNRKKVYKNIHDAKENIKKLEIKAGYAGIPIYKHLHEYIKTGVVCQYTIPLDKQLNWVF